MNLDILLLGNLTLDQQGCNLLAMISLQLDNLATILLVGHNIAIASKILLEDLQYPLRVELLGEPLDGGQGLASISLVKSYI